MPKRRIEERVNELELMAARLWQCNTCGVILHIRKAGDPCPVCNKTKQKHPIVPDKKEEDRTEINTYADDEAQAAWMDEIIDEIDPNLGLGGCHERKD